MAFRYVVRCLALAAVALVAMGCSSGAFPAPSSAGTQGTGSVRGPKPVASAGAAARLTATGTVTVRSGGKVVCVMTIKNGTGTCTVSAKNYKPGTVSFAGAYSGGDGMKASTSKPLSVRLQKAPKAK